MEIIPLLAAGALFLLGILGTFLPVLPGAVLIWGGMLLYGVLTGFARLGLNFYLLQGMAVLLIIGLDYAAAAWGTHRFGGTRRAAVGAAVGLLLGLVTMGPAGLIFGPFLGAFLGELTGGLPAEKALRSSLGALMGLVGAVFIKLAIEGVMIFWFFKTVLVSGP